MLLLLILHCFKSLIYLFRSTDISGRKQKNSFWSSFLLNLNYSVTDKGKKKKNAQRHIYNTEILKISTEKINLSWTEQLHTEQSSSFSRSR